jgi:hypothetical protein
VGASSKIPCSNFSHDPSRARFNFCPSAGEPNDYITKHIHTARSSSPGLPAAAICAEGFTNIIDIAFDKDGNLYVLEITHNGLLSEDMTGGLIKVAPDGTQTILATDGLVAPGGITIGPDGMIYISNFGVFPGAGEVIRMSPNPSATAMSAQFDAPDAMDAPFQVYIPILKH